MDGLTTDAIEREKERLEAERLRILDLQERMAVIEERFERARDLVARLDRLSVAAPHSRRD